MRSVFTQEAKRCVFEHSGEFERWTLEKERLDPEKVFVRFRVFKEEEGSFVSLLYRAGTSWCDGSSFQAASVGRG